MLIKRGRVWQSRIMMAGFLHQKSLKTRDKQEALRREAVFRLELTSGDFGLTAGKMLTLHAFEERFFNALEIKVKPRSMKYYKDAWKPMMQHSIAWTRLDRITVAVIEDFKQKRAKDVAVVTLNHSLRTLRRALRLANDWNLINKVPKIALLPNEHQREFTIDEKLLGKMLAHEKCTPSLRGLLPFLIDTGLRMGEALALEWPAVDLKKKTVTVVGGKTKFARRTIPLTQRAFNTLTDLRAKAETQHGEDHPSGTVFQEFGTHFYLNHQMSTLRKAMKLPDDCVLHSTRHTFCTRLGASGVDAFTLQKLAGHSSITVSARYVHPDAHNMAAAIARLEPKVDVLIQS
ncbi:MAG TPA: integrase [Terriglobales bacterium]